MRLRDLDTQRWLLLAGEIDALCDEIAEDPTPDEPLSAYVVGQRRLAGEWPEDSVAVEVWRLLNQASILATLHGAYPRVTMTQLRSLGRGT